ncbi:MAG: MFS transporter [Proteobacteria bacterium]|nr:MFS transporter [Pseudomonadota bacterium]
MNSTTLPVMADSRALRLAGFAGLYAAQGLPWGLFMVALPTWLASQGHSSAEVGIFLATVSFPWTLKLLAGPIMDRFSFLAMGRRRPWVLGAQLGILVGCLVLSLGIDDFAWILAVGFGINFCAAWQDVAVDGLAIDVLPENERAQTNAFMFGGQTLGISSASAGGAWLLANYGLSSAAWVMALCVALIACIPLLFRERQGERLLPWTEGEALPRSYALQETEWGKIFGNLFKVLILPMSLLLIVVKFGDRVAAGIFGAAMPVLTTQELGFSSTFYPEWMAIAGIVAAVFGVIVAPFIDRVTAQRALFWGLSFKILVISAGALLVDYWVNPNVLVILFFIYAFASQWLTIASISLFMNLCATKIAASQFAVYMAMSNLALSVGSALIGPLDAILEFHEIFYVIAAIDLAMLGLLVFFNLEKHKVRLNAIVGNQGE